MSDCAVKTRYGTFNGFVDKQGVKTWLGIPYAQPPVGKFRWQAPQPLAPSDKSFDVTKFGAQPAQMITNMVASGSLPQGEDCLTLNIWTRGEKKNKPVMVFIHGVGFQGGGSSDPLYSGTNIATAHEVIFVSFNYRLNVFGFVNFASIDPTFADCGGSPGIKDQVAALTWVKENIANFDGNPDNITIFGESAGAISCMMLAVLPAAKGLFAKTIPQSGNFFMYNTLESSTPVAAAYMELGGAKTMSDMMKKSSTEMVKLYETVKTARTTDAVKDCLPTCDGKYLPLDPFKALKDGAARGIKFLTGTTADEWRPFWVLDDIIHKLFHERKDYAKFSPVLQKYKAQTADELYSAWLANRPDTEEAYVDFATQLDWRVVQELEAENQSKFEDVYLYVFTQPADNAELGSCHAVDLSYTFGIGDHTVPNPAPNLVKIIQASWAAFATNGNPDNEFIPHWEKYTADNRQTMELNSKGCVLHKDLNTQNLNELRFLYEN